MHAPATMNVAAPNIHDTQHGRVNKQRDKHHHNGRLQITVKSSPLEAVCTHSSVDGTAGTHSRSGFPSRDLEFRRWVASMERRVAPAGDNVRTKTAHTDVHTVQITCWNTRELSRCTDGYLAYSGK